MPDLLASRAMSCHGEAALRAAVRALAGIAMAAAVGLAPAAAQNQVPPVIGVVDVQHVLREAKAAQVVREAAEAHGRELEERLNRQREELKAQEQQLRQQQAILSPDAFNKRREELERHVADVRRRTEEARNQLNAVFNVAMRDLRNELHKTVVAIMKEKGLNMALPRSAVLVYDERLNVTEDVLAQLNERLPTIAVDFDNPPKLDRN